MVSIRVKVNIIQVMVVEGDEIGIRAEVGIVLVMVAKVNYSHDYKGEKYNRRMSMNTYLLTSVLKYA